MIYAVIDTNVLVSALLTSHADSATVMVMNAVINGDIIPMYNKEILKEYEEVLSRKKFHFSKSLIKQYLKFFSNVGIASERVHSMEDLPDPKDSCCCNARRDVENPGGSLIPFTDTIPAE